MEERHQHCLYNTQNISLSQAHDDIESFIEGTVQNQICQDADMLEHYLKSEVDGATSSAFQRLLAAWRQTGEHRISEAMDALSKQDSNLILSFIEAYFSKLPEDYLKYLDHLVGNESGDKEDKSSLKDFYTTEVLKEMLGDTVCIDDNSKIQHLPVDAYIWLDNFSEELRENKDALIDDIYERALEEARRWFSTFDSCLSKEELSMGFCFYDKLAFYREHLRHMEIDGIMGILGAWQVSNMLFSHFAYKHYFSGLKKTEQFIMKLQTQMGGNSITSEEFYKILERRLKSKLDFHCDKSMLEFWKDEFVHDSQNDEDIIWNCGTHMFHSCLDKSSAQIKQARKGILKNLFKRHA